jgi:peroxiredoxin
MTNITTGLLILASICVTGPSPDTPEGPKASIIQAEVDKTLAELIALRNHLADNNASDDEIAKSVQPVSSSIDRMLRAVREHPDDPYCVVALKNIIEISRDLRTNHVREAMALLADRYSRAPGGAEIGGKTFVLFYMPEVERLLRAIIKDNPSREERARAYYELAYALRWKAGSVEALRAKPEKIRSLYGTEPWRTELVARTVREVDTEATMREVESILEKCAKEFGDIKGYDSRSIGEVASGELTALRKLAVGQPALEITGVNLDGRRSRLSDLRGKVTLLLFSYQDCPGCIEIRPQLRELVKRYATEEFVVVEVNTDSDAETLRKSLQSGEKTWHCWWDGGTEGPITTEWGVTSFPAIFLLDREGVIRSRDKRNEALDRDVEALIKRAPLPSARK